MRWLACLGSIFASEARGQRPAKVKARNAYQLFVADFAARQQGAGKGKGKAKKGKKGKRSKENEQGASLAQAAAAWRQASEATKGQWAGSRTDGG